MTNLFHFLLILLPALVFTASRAMPDKRRTVKSSVKSTVLSKVIDGTSPNYLSYTLFPLFLTKTMGLEGKQGYGCTVEITNNMIEHKLVNPRVFLTEGFTKVPPGLRIKAGGVKGAANAVIFEAAYGRILRWHYASEGVLSYEISQNSLENTIKKIIYIYWKVTQEETLYQIECTGKSQSMGDWKEHLEIQLRGISQPDEERFDAANIGQFVKENTCSDIEVRAHMTNSKNAKMIVLIKDKVKDVGGFSTVFKRDFGASLAVGMTSTALNVLTNRLINFLLAKRVLVITLQNNSPDIILDEPAWQMSGVVINDPVPFEIAHEQFNTITLTVSFGSGESFIKSVSSSVFVLSFKIRGTEQRIAFAMKWPKKISRDKFHEYSVFSLSHSKDIVEKLKHITSTIQEAKTETIADETFRTKIDPQKLAEWGFSTSNRCLFPYVKADTYQEYQSWKYALTNPLQEKVLKVSTFMGSKEEGTGINIYFESTAQKGDIPERVNPSPYVDE